MCIILQLSNVDKEGAPHVRMRPTPVGLWTLQPKHLHAALLT